jgi:hypothetical protein
MAGMFLSYDRDDVDKARPLAAALEKAGHDVWWDLHVRGGAQFSKVIEEALRAADAVVVLWSRQSVESAWVKDEASAGRDSGKLIPLSLDGTSPPLGFGQFQTIDFSRWKGRGKAPEFQTLLAAVDGLEPTRGETRPQAPTSLHPRPKLGLRRSWLIASAVAILVTVVGLSLAAWRPWDRTGLAVIAVRASDQNPASQAFARDLVVQLGALRSVLSSSMRLVDAGSGSSDRPDLVFKTTAVADGEGANLILSDANDEVLWSKQFDDPKTRPADRRQQIAFTAAGVLRCALQESSGKYGRLQSDLRQAFLDACAASSDVDWDTRSLIKPLRQVTDAAPNFRPAWAQLLRAEENAASLPGNADAADTVQALRQDIKRARNLFPDIAEATTAELAAAPDLTNWDAVALVDKAKSQDPDNPPVLMDHAIVMASVGRVADGLDDLQRAAQLDPLSPVTRKYLIRALAYAGDVNAARAELARAKQLWPGTATIREAEGTIEGRYGDFERVLRDSGEYQQPGVPLYVAARKNPTDANVARYVDFLTKERGDRDRLALGIQGLGEMNRVNEIYALLAAAPVETALKDNTYILFRPWLAEARRDPRFMVVAQRLGLMSYWQKSGHWPDFCSDPGLKYDCKAEAARLST